MKELIKSIDAVLPQTQCGECGFNGCLPYAEALAEGRTPINKCPPGGVITVQRLSEILSIDSAPYIEEIRSRTRPPAVAIIREAECIGCTKCIQACPVDAIVGSSKQMHSIIQTECTGCGLCVEPCPVDCIELLPIPVETHDRTVSRQRYDQKKIRSIREQHEQQQSYRAKTQLTQKAASSDEIKARQAYILNALQRVSSKKS